VVGSGYWGKNLVRNFAELGALHTVCDTDPEVTGKFKAQYPEIKVCEDYRHVLQDEAVKGVVIAAPAVLHYPWPGPPCWRARTPLWKSHWP